MSTIDLRSDTVTRPVSEMRIAIADAAVGDDVFGDDPTVNRLEQHMAALLGKEAALYVPSGTMGNTIALTTITEHGDEVIIERESHIFNYEVAGVAAIGGVQFNAIDGDRGVITAEDIEGRIRPTPTLHQPRTAAIAIENTHNRAAGRVYPLETMRRIRELADANGLQVHLDGARLANAVAASGVSFGDYAACADTVSMCFSKGLGAPVGSIVAATGDVIARARRRRKMLGGGMRQAGILAAAALYAVENHVERMKEDHDHASALAEAVESIDGLSLLFPVETNIVIVRVDPGFATVEDLLGYLSTNGVMAHPFGAGLFRLVTHLDVDRDDVDRAIEVLRAFES